MISGEGRAEGGEQEELLFVALTTSHKALYLRERA